jgi:hypothetical protein
MDNAGSLIILLGLNACKGREKRQVREECHKKDKDEGNRVGEPGY